MTKDIVFISQAYFNDKNPLLEVLDSDDSTKQSTRCYLRINYEDNSFYVPLRRAINNNLPNTGYPIPSTSRPYAGFDFRKALVINDEKYIQKLEQLEISNSQQVIIKSNAENIKESFKAGGVLKSMILTDVV